MKKIPYINQVIKDRKKELKINQVEFSEILQKSLSTIKKYDSGSPIPLETLKMICDKLSFNISELLVKQEESNKENDTNYYQDLIDKNNIELRKLFSSMSKNPEEYLSLADSISEYMRIFVSPYSKKKYICEYENEKFYIKELSSGISFIALNFSQAEKLVKDTRHYFEYLLFLIQGENLKK